MGRGKFSSVYKVVGPEGKYYALKHTPLHPHHPLIAARLLREPTLLSQLPPHPNLIGVHGTIRTPGHFYLIEEYAAKHVPLTSHPLPLKPSRAAFILDQLVSVLRDCLHKRGRVVHRDLKGENVLVDIETGEIVLLDLGLATHYSASEPKLTTCCGSPAFHSPEIVRALSQPPGEVSYYGPELDIWCIALTLLSLLLQTRFPLGASHKSTFVMRDRAIDRLQELDEAYPPSAPWRCVASDVPASEREYETSEWKRVRNAMRDFLDINGNRRMVHFDEYPIGPQTADRVADFSADERKFKSTSFEPVDIRHTMPLYLQSGSGSGPVTLSNPTGLSERRVVSYLKYILRSRGILYHCLPGNGNTTMLQLVLPYPSQSTEAPTEKEVSWVSSLFLQKRSASLPPKARSQRHSPSRKGEKKEKQGEMEWALKCYLKIECSYSDQQRCTSPATQTFDLPPISPVLGSTSVQRRYPRPPPSRTHSVEGIGRTSARAPSRQGSRASSVARPIRPTPLSRQVSIDSQRSVSSFDPLRFTSPASTITLTLSDPRGYGVLRTVLDVKHEGGHTPPSPMIPVPVVNIQGEQDDESADGTETRGRPRSKEDSHVLVALAPTTHDIRVEVADSCDANSNGKNTPRDTSRGRKGFLDGWFGLGNKEDAPRPVSLPPAATTGLSVPQVSTVSSRPSRRFNDSITRPSMLVSSMGY